MTIRSNIGMLIPSPGFIFLFLTLSLSIHSSEYLAVAGEGIEELVKTRLSEDGKTLDLRGKVIGPKGAKKLTGMEQLSGVETLLLQPRIPGLIRA